MERETLTPFRRRPTFKQLDARLWRRYDVEGDQAAGVEVALEIRDLLSVHSQPIDLERDFAVVSHGAEALWDSGEPEAARTLVALWRRTVLELCEHERRDASAARIWSAILSARLEHRVGHPRTAIGYILEATQEIRRLAGGEPALQAIIRRGRVEPILEMYGAALAIALPAADRYLKGRPTIRRQMLEAWLADAKTILDRDMPPRLMRAHALTIQTFYRLADAPPSAEVDDWLDRLERFDDLLRPPTRRGQATRRLRDVARARHEGDSARELEQAERARQELDFLPRHVEALGRNRWWPLRATA